MNFTTFHSLYTEELALKRARQVRKSLQRKRKFKYGTFGFDIEFYYSEDIDDNQIQEWMNYIDNDDDWSTKFDQYLMELDDNPGYYNMDDWEESNPEPDKPSIAQFAKPEPNMFPDNADYVEALEYWSDVEQEWEEYSELYEQHVEEYNMMESQLIAWDKLRRYHLKNFAEDNLSDAYEHIDIQTSSGKVDQYTYMLEDLGENVEYDTSKADFTTDWVVALDGDRPEIASRILTTKDIPLVRSVLEELSGEATSPNTSAHVHVGMPNGFDMFSLFSLYSLVDEKSIEQKMPGRDFQQWSQSSFKYLSIINDISREIIEGKLQLFKVTRDTGEVMIRDEADVKRLHREDRVIQKDPDGKIIKDTYSDIEKYAGKKFSIFNHYHTPEYNYDEYQIEWFIGDKPGITVEPVEIKKINDSTIEFTGDDVFTYLLRRVTEKFSGVNVSYFKQRNTVEFRYLSSVILNDIDEFLNFINYFLLLPHIAQRAKRINTKNASILKGPDKRYRIILKNT